MHGDEEGVYSTKRTPESRRLPVPITSFSKCEGYLDVTVRVMVMVTEKISRDSLVMMAM